MGNIVAFYTSLEHLILNYGQQLGFFCIYPICEGDNHNGSKFLSLCPPFPSPDIICSRALWPAVNIFYFGALFVHTAGICSKL